MRYIALFGVVHLAACGLEPFPPCGGEVLVVTPRDIKQYGPDCWLQAPLLWMATFRPEVLGNQLHWDGTTLSVGLYDPSGKPHWVTVTQVDVNNFDSDSPLLPWAWPVGVQVALEKQGINTRAPNDPAVAFVALSGVEAPDEAVAGFDGDTLKGILGQYKEHPTVACTVGSATGNDATIPDSVVFEGHCYAVLGFNGKTVSLGNPWGYDDAAVSLSDFRRDFSFISQPLD